MKISLTAKLTIFIFLLFGAVIAGCILWTPLRIAWHVSMLGSEDSKKRKASADWLLGRGEEGMEALALELKGGTEAAEFLAEHWKNVNEKMKNESFERFPLHIAVGKKWSDVTGLLIAGGAEVDSKDADEWTPLCWAAREGDRDSAELLLKNGADINSIDKFECTPLDYAILMEHETTAAFLRAHDAKTGAELRYEKGSY
ncbi:MAG: ankyrin repeat domain-containing protein [Planctomycetota bacterium]|jgi:hypothetical protein